MDIKNVGNEAVLKTVSLMHKGQTAGEMVIKVGNRIFINNNSLEPLNLAAGTMIAGFGQGTWKLDSRDEIDTDVMILYELKKSDTMVQFNNSYVTLLSVMKSKTPEESSS